MLLCSGEANVTECVVSTMIGYTHFNWLIYKLKWSRQEVIRTCLKQRCVRSIHERQKQTESEMKGLILIRLLQCITCFLKYYSNNIFLQREINVLGCSSNSYLGEVEHHFIFIPPTIFASQASDLLTLIYPLADLIGLPLPSSR